MSDFFFIVLAADEGGGLFDFGATLPLIAVQFLLLMFVLNLILYTPLISLMNQRNTYIVSNLNQASDILLEANQLVSQYEDELAQTKKQAQQDLLKLQTAQKKSFEEELVNSQNQITTVVQKVLTDFMTKKQNLLDSLTNDINVLSSLIYKELFAL